MMMVSSMEIDSLSCGLDSKMFTRKTSLQVLAQLAILSGTEETTLTCTHEKDENQF
jgi:hypothetical protein